jgi:hypothetical protein
MAPHGLHGTRSRAEVEMRCLVAAPDGVWFLRECGISGALNFAMAPAIASYVLVRLWMRRARRRPGRDGRSYRHLHSSRTIVTAPRCASSGLERGRGLWPSRKTFPPLYGFAPFWSIGPSSGLSKWPYHPSVRAVGVNMRHRPFATTAKVNVVIQDRKMRRVS